MAKDVRRLEIFFMSPRGRLLPQPHSEGSDNHPFWQQLDACMEQVAAEVEALGQSPPHQWLWCTRYAADWCRDSYYNIPPGAIGEKRLAMTLSYLSKARQIAPQLIWQKLTLDGVSIDWDEATAQFQMPTIVDGTSGAPGA
jgi:hypothetical protein